MSRGRATEPGGLAPWHRPRAAAAPRRVWVLSPFSEPSHPATFDRYAWICGALAARGAEVTQFVSAFDHGRKARRAVPAGLPWRAVPVPEPGYARNVGVARLASHLVFDALVAPALAAEALRGGRPHALLAALPHEGAAAVAGLLCKAAGARFVVDVHDTWPESVLAVTRLGTLGRAGYRAWRATADLAYRLADDAFAGSHRYAARADEVRLPRGRPAARAIPLGGDAAWYAAVAPAAALPAPLAGTSFLVGYVGALGENYDLDTALDAVADLAAGHPGVALAVLGAGEREAALRRRADRLGLRAWFSGRRPHAELVALLKRCHVGLNCFRPGGNVAFSYKLTDYLLAGVPVVNALEGEAAELIARHGLGESYPAGSRAGLARALEACRTRREVDPAWSGRIARWAAGALDRERAYAPLLECLLHE